MDEINMNDLNNEKNGKLRQIRSRNEKTKNHKFKENTMLKVSVILLFCFFFTYLLFVDRILEEFEFEIIQNKKFFIFRIFNKEIITSPKVQKIFFFILELFFSPDSLIVYLTFLYIFYSPFIAVKLSFITNSLYFCIVLIKVAFHSHRPFWDQKYTTICCLDYGNPSLKLVNCYFFFLYTIISLKQNKKGNRFENKTKNIIIIFYVVFIIFILFLFCWLFVYYIYQIINSLIISIMAVCVLVELKGTINNSLISSLKNIYNIRDRNFKSFFVCLLVSIITFVFCSLFTDESLPEAKQIARENENCKINKLNYIGIKETLLDLGHFFGIPGAFFGVGFTMEKCLDKWWKIKDKKENCIKFFLMLITDAIFVFLKIYFKEYFSIYEFSFAILYVLGFLHYFTAFGIVPYLFSLIKKKMKKDIENEINNFDEEPLVINKKEKYLFHDSIFKEELYKLKYGCIEVLEKFYPEEQNIYKSIHEEIKNDIENDKNFSSEIVSNRRSYTFTL